MNEEGVRILFSKSGIIEELGYEDKDVYAEERIKGGKRTDIHCTDDYKNVIFVIEFKKPSVKNLEEHMPQLWEMYVLPLRAKYGILTNGLEMIVYERIKSNYNRLFKWNLGKVSKEDAGNFVKLFSKPRHDLTKIEQVVAYFDNFRGSEERLNLKLPKAREHFFKNFKMERDSIFANLLKNTVKLFESEYTRSKFLTSAYDFWKKSYAKSPEKIPAGWEEIIKECGLKSSKEDLFKFMFCLETAYAVFTRLILSKACEDYRFPDILFSRFIENEIQRASRRGDIPAAGWAKITHDLIRDMRRKLIASVFEEDIFYWWTDSFRDLEYEQLYERAVTRQMMLFGMAMAKILLTMYKYDFSEIKGDPLGKLYQQYFDKETRKALGEFYTPQEIVDYILDAVDYGGHKILDKRLLDPACGSGTFLVTALKRYLEASKAKAEEVGWDKVLDDLCNRFLIVGFDIHPFAIIMAQTQFTLVLLPYYKMAIEENISFVLKRLPIFRTDSLLYETKGEAMTLAEFGRGQKGISMKIKLPVQASEKDEFFEEAFVMPFINTVLSQTDLLNYEEYFASLQAIFDVVKESAEEGIYTVNEEILENGFKEYLENKSWSQLVNFFKPYADDLLARIKKLKHEFEDGRLVKSIEDVFLAAILKSFVKYDFVVGNPPYVRIQSLSPEQKEYYSKYYEVEGNYDLFIPFMERGAKWLRENGYLGYINPDRYTTVNYGKLIRKWLIKNTVLIEYLDFLDTGVFKDVLNYPAINIFRKSEKNENVKIKCCRMIRKPKDLSNREILTEIKKGFKKLKKNAEFLGLEFCDLFIFDSENLTEEKWLFMPLPELIVFNWLNKNKFRLIDISTTEKKDSALSEGSSTGAKPIFVVELVDDTLKDCIKIKSLEDKNVYEIERDITKLYAENAGRWLPEEGNFVIIFPYKKMNGGIVDYTIEEIMKKFPKTYEYLVKFKNKLESRKGFSKNKPWFSYSAPRSLHLVDQKKILVQGFSEQSSVSFDSNGHYMFGPDIYVFQIKDCYLKFLNTLLCILNSNITNFFVKHVGVIHGSGYFKFEDRFLKNLPIKISHKRYQKECDKLLNQIYEIIEFGRKTASFPLKYNSKLKSVGGEFSSVAIKFGHKYKSILPEIQKRQDGSYNVILENRENIATVDTKEKAKFVTLALEGKSFKKNEKAEILIPKSNTVVKKILEEYENDKKELQGAPSVEELENQLNKIVYKIYGLKEKEIKIVEDFLKKF